MPLSRGKNGQENVCRKQREIFKALWMNELRRSSNNKTIIANISFNILLLLKQLLAK